MTNEYELTDLGATEYGALVRDARRYRWLREQGRGEWEVVEWPSCTRAGFALRLDELDAAIDAAMEAAK